MWFFGARFPVRLLIAMVLNTMACFRVGRK